MNDTPRNRHDPSAPKYLLGELQERMSQAGSKYFFGFVGERKYLLLPSRIPGFWNLYWQPLNDAKPEALKIQSETSPPTQPRSAPPERLPFVSGLPD